jgi:zinc-binding in reverse transcriptase
MNRFPSLYSQARYSDASVADQCKDGNWEILLNVTLNVQAQTEKHQLQQDLAAVQLRPVSDVPVWIRSSSMKFSVKSAYLFLTETPHIADNTFNLWDIKVPPRVEVFLWLQLRRKLLTIENMRNRGWIIPSICYLCRQCEENVTHIFTDCEYTKHLRRYVADAMPPTKSPCDIYRNSITPNRLITGSYDIFWRQIEATTTFCNMVGNMQTYLSRQVPGYSSDIA